MFFPTLRFAVWVKIPLFSMGISLPLRVNVSSGSQVPLKVKAGSVTLTVAVVGLDSTSFIPLPSSELITDEASVDCVTEEIIEEIADVLSSEKGGAPVAFSVDFITKSTAAIAANTERTIAEIIIISFFLDIFLPLREKFDIIC